MVVFVDTNVLLYWRDATEPHKQPIARGWIDHLWRERTGRLSTQVLSEYYANALRPSFRGSLSPERAWADVDELLAWKPQPIDTDLLARAHAIHQRYRSSWWDALIIAAAQLQGCDLLLTEDLQDGLRFSDLTVRDPFRLSVEEAQATYGRPAPQRARLTRAAR